jgi:hypothetical protein
MKFGCRKIIILVCLLIEFRSLSSTLESSAREKPLMRQEIQALEEHESDGPGGTQGIPMQRASMSQSVLVCLVLTFGGGLAYMSRKKPLIGRGEE